MPFKFLNLYKMPLFKNAPYLIIIDAPQESPMKMKIK